MNIQIGIIGGSEESISTWGSKRDLILEAARQVGFLVAKENAILITGGMDGVMRSACQGAKEAGGITVGTPGRNRGDANEFVDVEVCTPIDVGDFLFAGLMSCDAIVVLPGGPGTWAEIYLAYRMKIPMVVYTGFSEEFDKLVGTSLDDHNKVIFGGANNADDCVSAIMNLVKTT